MVIQNLKGVTDFNAATMTLRNQVTDVLRRHFELYGFQPLDTALLNYRDLLTYKYGEQAEIVKEIYCLSDQGARDLGLRFDLTVPFCKFIALNRSLKLPFKRYEIGKVFRNGPVKAGRLREFVQCDIDVVGDGGRLIEAELLELAIKAFLELGITPEVQINNRKLLTGLIDLVGGTTHQDVIISILDKIQKVTPAETLTELQKFLPAPQAQTLMQYVQTDLTHLSQILPNNAGLAEIKELFQILDIYGLSNYCRFTPSLARGLNVYTGMVWEVFEARHHYQSSLGGGGRYDQIITNFVNNGLAYPAVGMSFGLEPITTLLEHHALPANKTQLLIVPLGTLAESNQLANQLRAQGVNTLLWTAKPKVGKALEYAAASQIRYAAVIGTDEVNQQQITLKDLTTGTTQTVAWADQKGLLKILSKH